MMSDEERDMPGMLPFSNEVLLAVGNISRLILSPNSVKKCKVLCNKYWLLQNL